MAIRDGVLDRIAGSSRPIRDLNVMGGNVATYDGARALIDAGVDAIKVGIGPGSICTTRIVAGIGVPQITAIAEASRGAAKRTSRSSPTAASAIRATSPRRSSPARVASWWAACSRAPMRAPGEVELYQGRTYKSYRGMGSLGAMSQANGSSDRYFQESRRRWPQAGAGRHRRAGRVPWPGQPHRASADGRRARVDGLHRQRRHPTCAPPEFVRVSGASMVESMSTM